MNAGMVLDCSEVNFVNGGSNSTNTCQCSRKDVLLPAVKNVLILSSATASIVAAVIHLYPPGTMSDDVQQRRLVLSTVLGGAISIVAEMLVASF